MTWRIAEGPRKGIVPCSRADHPPRHVVGQLFLLGTPARRLL